MNDTPPVRVESDTLVILIGDSEHRITPETAVLLADELRLAAARCRGRRLVRSDER